MTILHPYRGSVLLKGIKVGENLKFNFDRFSFSELARSFSRMHEKFQPQMERAEANRQAALRKLAEKKRRLEFEKQKSEAENVDEISNHNTTLAETHSNDSKKRNLVQTFLTDKVLPVCFQLVSFDRVYCSPEQFVLRPLIAEYNVIFTKGGFEFNIKYYQTFLQRLKTDFKCTIYAIPESVLHLRPPKIFEFDLSDIDSKLRNSLMTFQVQGINRMLSLGGKGILADEMGLGKTVQALAVCCYYRREWPLLVISPASLVVSWKEAVLQWLPSIEEVEVNIVNETGKITGLVNVISYDIAVKYHKELSGRFNCIIADECHNIKNPSTKRCKALLPILQKANRTILLSGTPALSRPIELFTQIQAITKKLFPRQKDFSVRYCNGHQGYFGWDSKGCSNDRELLFVLENSIMIRRLKQDVMKELPPKIRHQVFVPIKKKAKVKQIPNLSSIEDAGSETFMRLWMETAMQKMDSMLDFVFDHVESGAKLLLFAHHQEIIETFEKEIIKKRIGYIRIDGRVKTMDRQALCTRFQTDENIRIAILSITAASTGLTLTSASLVIFAELFWNPGVLVQAEDRAHRIGQKDSINVCYLLGKGTLDDKLWPLLERKMQVLTKMGIGNEFSNSGISFDKNQKTLDGSTVGKMQ